MMEPHDFWQTIEAADDAAAAPFQESYPARLPDGCILRLPIRVLPGDGSRAVASLIVNQASFAVEDMLAAGIADLVRPYAADVIVGVPTLGLSLANGVARRLGHQRHVPLGTSRKFWYRDEWSEPLSSITTPGGGKRLYVDPRMLPLLQGKRVVVVDDVISSGASMAAVLRLLGRVEVAPVAVAVAMLQTARWRETLVAVAPGILPHVHGVLSTPMFAGGATDGWRAVP
jgi:adenine/guanine phosphoribosyltransferase-like PRPP-binding protein